jgi:uncharacterized repeat protein (TIGR03803 family)
VLHLFPPFANPEGRLVFDGSGNLYGITYGDVIEARQTRPGLEDSANLYGIIHGAEAHGSQRGAIFDQRGGTVFELSPDAASERWKYTVLHNFCPLAPFNCSDGAGPVAGVIIDASGDLYGVTQNGGASDQGTVFELSYDANAQNWNETVLYSFCALTDCSDGAGPSSGLIMDGSGNLYGTTYEGGAHAQGAVFKLSYDAGTQSWNEMVLYSFCAMKDCADGNDPNSLVRDSAGNLYGATYYGGGAGGGTAFELSYETAANGWKEKVLHNFCPAQYQICTSGSWPNSVVMDGSGNLYGTTSAGGRNNDSGTAFALTHSATDGTWAETVLHNFCWLSDCKDGKRPLGLTIASTGILYGTTLLGGVSHSSRGGTVFALNYDSAIQGWRLTSLYSFCDPACADGRAPSGPVIIDTAGNLYGTTFFGADERGGVFRLQP